MNEHTAEFALVPVMKRLLEERFKSVVPIFPWLSREFGNQSKNFHGASEFYVLAMFPRRPKISDDGEVFVTINGELAIFKEIGIKHGITVIAGCPKATNFWELASCKECVWLDIDHSYEYLTHIDSINGDKRLNEQSLTNSIEMGRKHSMDSLEEFIRDTRYVLPAGFFGVRYKPVYFLVFEH